MFDSLEVAIDGLPVQVPLCVPAQVVPDLGETQRRVHASVGRHRQGLVLRNRASHLQ